MIILGVDPGLQRTGYGLIDSSGPEKMTLIEAGVVRTDSDDNISGRLVDIYKNLIEIIDEYKPEALVLEKIFAHYKHPATAILMGHARGVICLACGVKGIKLINYPSTRIKKAVTGNGRASKRQVQQSVKAFLGLKSDPEPVDISDALAMAICYVFMEGIDKTM
jgi:crossover junction endodeoxyribonuclease RuvC